MCRCCNSFAAPCRSNWVTMCSSALDSSPITTLWARSVVPFVSCHIQCPTFSQCHVITSGDLRFLSRVKWHPVEWWYHAGWQSSGSCSVMNSRLSIYVVCTSVCMGSIAKMDTSNFHHLLDFPWLWVAVTNAPMLFWVHCPDKWMVSQQFSVNDSEL